VTNYYIDASALVKRYTREPGSTWVLQITEPSAQHTILLAEITFAEVAAALAAKQRAPGDLTPLQGARILSRFLQDCVDHFLLLPVDRLVIDRAVEVTQRYRVRGYDAVQLATVIVTRETIQSHHLPSPVFVAADRDLPAAVGTEQLPTENPLDHVALDAPKLSS